MVLNSRFVSLAALCTLVTVFFPSTVHVAAASVHHYDSNIKARDGSQATDHVYLRSTYPSVKYTHDRIDRRGRNNMHDEKSAQETSRGKKGTEHFKKQACSNFTSS
ncbi:hypothetical protein SERLA73DRAFT_75850 [Serpula lacrymans var. lacrymans S7.3]|uniref:Secreted protein n=1 Tax=Serpula lacrymans var. lacrymans (strain S7.3) TaxID=936435 RepID=F8Q4F1_SERL3|nr:hypothetical protein SERLA73DRAFT_75850 [Serpula lacrymans var. lacrymans S7.3]